MVHGPLSHEAELNHRNLPPSFLSGDGEDYRNDGAAMMARLA